ncbi:MAG: SND2/TMEM208 family protein [Bacilli bacterium]
MNKNKIKDIIYIVIAIILSVLAFRFVIWLMPIIIVLILAYFIYKSLNKNSKQNNKKVRNIKVIHDDEKDNK